MLTTRLSNRLMPYLTSAAWYLHNSSLRELLMLLMPIVDLSNNVPQHLRCYQNSYTYHTTNEQVESSSKNVIDGDDH